MQPPVSINEVFCSLVYVSMYVHLSLGTCFIYIETIITLNFVVNVMAHAVQIKENKNIQLINSYIINGMYGC